MQALNLQILETQNSKNQPKNFSSLKSETKPGMSFRDMVKSMSKKNSFEKKEVKYETKNQKVSEPVQNEKVENNVSEKTDAKKSADSVKENKKPETENKNKIAKNESNKISSEEVREEPVPAEEAEIEEAVNSKISVEAIPAEFMAAEKIQAQTENVGEKAAEENLIIVNDSEYSFLKTKAPSKDDPLAIIENAVEYESADTEDLIVNAQDLSAEDPEKFLDGREIADENTEASEITLAAFGNLEQKLDSVDTKKTEKTDSAENNFKLEIADSDSKVQSEATKLFKNIFTVTDNRSTEEKVEQFKTMINESADKASENNINLSLSLSENATQNITSSNSQAAGASGSTFQEMLTQQIQTNVPDFVKAGNIVLRDNNQGSINMILKPEALGNVKINLQVADNVVTGQITVHSKEAFEAFKQNMDSLRQAFQNSGFENAELNLSFADNSSSGAFAQQGERQQGTQQFFGNKTYRTYAASADSDDYAETSASYESGIDKQVSIVA